MYKNNINLNESAYYIGASMAGCSRQWNCKHLDPVDSMQLVLNPKFALLKTNQNVGLHFKRKFWKSSQKFITISKATLF